MQSIIPPAATNSSLGKIEAYGVSEKKHSTAFYLEGKREPKVSVCNF
jgi:hypothetical protein